MYKYESDKEKQVRHKVIITLCRPWPKWLLIILLRPPEFHIYCKFSDLYAQSHTTFFSPFCVFFHRFSFVLQYLSLPNIYSKRIKKTISFCLLCIPIHMYILVTIYLYFYAYEKNQRAHSGIHKLFPITYLFRTCSTTYSTTTNGTTTSHPFVLNKYICQKHSFIQYRMLQELL